MGENIKNFQNFDLKNAVTEKFDYFLISAKINWEIKMKVVVQRVDRASVSVDKKVVSKIGKGFLVLVGIEEGDSAEMVIKKANKVAGLRIFSDQNGKTNLSLADVGGEVLAVSQFTLCADCSHGFRPSFAAAMGVDGANKLFEMFVKQIEKEGIKVQTGVFGAHMSVCLKNNGPFTIIL